MILVDAGQNILFTGPGVFQIWSGCVCIALKTMLMFFGSGMIYIPADVSRVHVRRGGTHGCAADDATDQNFKK